MKRASFFELARESFGETLCPEGFETEKSTTAVFYRGPTEDGIYHVVSPDMNKTGKWYDIKVFATSECLEPEFDKVFPDRVGIPSDRYCYLDPDTGVGPDQEFFGCKTEHEFRDSYRNQAKPALVNQGLPYLDEIKTLNDLIPHIHDRLYLAYAKYYSGDQKEAVKLLKEEKRRFDGLGDEHPQLRAELRYINRLLEGL